MSKIKKNLYDYNLENGERIIYHGEYLEESIIFNFLNHNFNKPKQLSEVLRDIKQIFECDNLISSTSIINDDDLLKLTDYHAIVGEQISYFQVIQTELRPILKEIIQNIISPTKKSFKLIPTGPYSSIDIYLNKLGKLEYSSTFGNLVLIWKDKPTSFLQLLLRSLIAVTQYDRNILKYVVFCKQCQKIYINKDGRRTFCSRDCSTKHYDKNRDNVARYAKEISNDKYARSKKIDKKSKNT